MSAWSFTSLAATAAALLGACASAPPQAPAALDPGTGHAYAFTAAARGVQIYECRGGAWAFVAPEAELFDADGRRVGTHGAGPFWDIGGSRIVGAVRSRVDAPVPSTIPWLLLETRSIGGTGRLEKVTRVQRVATTGGAAPATPCAVGAAPLRVAYTADYHFYNPVR